MHSRVTSRPIFLVGFMGTGKSTVGLLLAARLERRFVDLDTRIEEEAHATISELFLDEGETRFREREAAALERLAQEGTHVVAVGGGAPTYGRNMDRMLAAGAVVALSASIEEIVARVGDAATRPLLANVPDRRAEVERLLAARAPFYGRAHFAVDTTGLAPSQIARQIAEELETWR
jgi:shikimate kinase